MTRILAAQNAAELQKTSVTGCVLVDLDFASGHLYLSDGFSECVFNGHTFLPLGQFGGIDVVDEGLDTVARPLRLTLSGCDPALVHTAQTEVYQNRKVTVYVGLLNQQTGTLIADPSVAWEGRMAVMTIDIDQNSGSITLDCEQRLRREPRIARYTDADQQQAHPGDDFFEFVTDITGFKSQWGAEKMTYGGPSNRPQSPNNNYASNL